ncbi:MAG: hypothetical protein CMH83_00545 [Nocardioides sp.]|nr:hypothetical protein [Nocardioides sp.]
MTVGSREPRPHRVRAARHRTNPAAAVAALALAVGTTLVPAAPSGASPAPAPSTVATPSVGVAVAAARATGRTVTKKRTLSWSGNVGRKKQVTRVGLPGTGQLALHCRPSRTEITLKADDRSDETQMWLAKYEDKSYGRAVAVKTARIYRYDTATSDGNHPTSNPVGEGLNQQGRIENYGQGYAHGVISSRDGRDTAVGGDPTAPVTTVYLDWYWNGFHHPTRYRSCTMHLTTITTVADPLGVSWHGDADAAAGGRHTTRATSFPGLGRMVVRCGAGGRSTFTLVPADDVTSIYVETIQGEGRVDQHVRTRTRRVNRDTGRIRPVSIPSNGMMRIFVQKSRSAVPFMLSSFRKTNDPQGRRNVCEVAVGRFPR